MDPLTQGAIGAAVAQSGSPPRNLARNAFAGALAGMLPDLDVLIRSSHDPLLFLEYHRHFTHSLAFIPVGGAATALTLSALSRGKASFRELLLPCILGWGSHGLLDACTSYGTHLAWPFSNERAAWHVVSIVDPLFTVPLLAFVVLAARRKKRIHSRTGLALALAYLAFGAVQTQRAEDIRDGLLVERGHTAERGQVKPSLGNNILFRSFYAHEGTFHVDAIRVPWFGAHRIYEGSSHPALGPDAYLAKHDLGPTAHDDLERFSHFSAGFLIEDPTRPGVIGDFRYAMVPNEVAPLWGIELVSAEEGSHAAWVTTREATPARREAFLAMLWGRDLPEAEEP